MLARVLFAATLLLAVSVALASKPLSSNQLRHTSRAPPHGWVKAARVDPTHTLPLLFAVKQRNMDMIEEWALKVSDPNSPFYGRHLSFEAINRLTANVEALAEVEVYLRSHHVAKENIVLLPNNFVQVKLPAATAEKMLNAQFHHFVHHKSGRKVIRAEAYTIPADLARSVEFVSALQFPTVRPPRNFQPLDVEADSFSDIPPGYTVPNILYKYYNISNPKVGNTKATSSVYESLGQSYSPDDLKQFQTYFGLPVQDCSQVIGPNTPSACAQDPNNCVEANLDVQYLLAVSQGSPLTYWSVPAEDREPWLDWIVAVGAVANPPLVHSISYGAVEQMGDPTEMQRFNQEASKLAARGITVIVASGDDGVANFPARESASSCGFFPSFPASAPFVTAVGATQGPENNTAEIAETSSAGGGITSGGGFSTQFSSPDYQTNAVKTFLSSSSTLPPVSQFASTGRAYPDIAIMGHNYIVFDGGQPSAGSGTSASAPVFAGMVNLANSARLSAGKSPLGFLNQVLYNWANTNPQIYHDITQGTNNCAAGDVGTAVCCQYGFTAQQGWDPVTGLGSINFAEFLKAALALP